MLKTLYELEEIILIFNEVSYLVHSWTVNTEVAFTERYLGVIDGYARYI